jgi:toxin FitB
VKYLLDTNVLSEIRRQERMDTNLKAWLGRTAENERVTSVLVIAEIRRGIESKRRKDVAQALAMDRWLARLRQDFAGRILAVDEKVADEWASMNVPNPMPAIDSLIGATAKVHGLVLVTRNARDFAKTKVSVLNPFAG